LNWTLNELLVGELLEGPRCCAASDDQPVLLGKIAEGGQIVPATKLMHHLLLMGLAKSGKAVTAFGPRAIFLLVTN
jgi:hypothetical protein